MRFASNRPSPSKRPLPPADPRTSGPQRLDCDRFFMHYNNGIYMGGMNAFKRNGPGLLLLDDGTSLLSDYCFDSLTNHNVLLRDNAIISLLFVRKGYEVAIRTGQCVLKLPFADLGDSPSGSGVLIDYQTSTMYHLIYQTGRLAKKIVESNRHVLEEVFSSRLRTVMDLRHEQAFKCSVKTENGIKIMKTGRKIVIGYADNGYILEGLAVKLKINEEVFEDFSQPLEIKSVERGFYRRGRLENFGERYFANGNMYIGEFRDDCFEGRGLLIYPKESKWVYGHFQGERLRKMIDMSLSEDSHPKPKLREVHELNTKNWMGVEVELLSWDLLLGKLIEALEYTITDVAVEKERQQREEEERLLLIEEHFRNEMPSREIDRILQEQMVKNKTMAEKVVIGEYGSLKPKVLEIQPRCAEN